MDENQDIDFPIENFSEFIQKMITESIMVLKNDAHIKVISIKYPIIVTNSFLKKIIKIDVLTDIIEKHVDKTQTEFSKERVVNATIVHNIIVDITNEIKTKVFSELANMNKMALFYDAKTNKCFWSFLENRTVPNEKDIISKKPRRNK